MRAKKYFDTRKFSHPLITTQAQRARIAVGKSLTITIRSTKTTE